MAMDRVVARDVIGELGDDERIIRRALTARNLGWPGNEPPPEAASRAKKGAHS